MPPSDDAIDRLVDEFFSVTQDLVLVADGETIVRVNGRWHDVLGFSDEQLVGHSVREFMHPDDMPLVASNIERMLTTGEPVVGHETQFKAPDGSWATLKWNVTGDPATGLILGNARDITADRAAARERDQLLEVLEAQAELQDLFLEHGITRDWWDAALARVLRLSACEFGFIGRVEISDETGKPYLRSLSVTDIAWNDWSRKLYDEFSAQGLEFHNLESLFGVTLATGETVISHDPATDARRTGIPPGHPPLITYMGIPIKDGDVLLGMVGLANRAGGFSQQIERDLEPVTRVLAQQLARERVEIEAGIARQQAGALGDTVSAMARAEDDRRELARGYDRVIAAGSVAGALIEAQHVLTALVPDAKVRLLVVDPTREGWLVRASATGEQELAVSRCTALLSGRMRITRPGLELGGCAHAPEDHTATICAPVATAEDQFGLLVVGIPEMHMLGEGDTRARLARLAEGVDDLADALAQVALREHLVSQALVDPLTGLANRRGLLQAVERRLARTDLEARPLGLIVLDLDDFKVINDHLGHLGGDGVLEAVGAALTGAVRGDDVVARLGGDEFAVMASTMDQQAVEAAAQRLREAVHGVQANGARLTCSVGAVLLGWGRDATWDAAYAAADQALYASKHAGKDHLTVADAVGVREQP